MFEPSRCSKVTVLLKQRKAVKIKKAFFFCSKITTFSFLLEVLDSNLLSTYILELHGIFLTAHLSVGPGVHFF